MSIGPDDYDKLFKTPMSRDELFAVMRDEAGLYRLSGEDQAAYLVSGKIPQHPDPSVIVIPEVVQLDDLFIVRWYRPSANN